MTAWTIEQGDVAQVLAGFNDNSFDALACDPPYGFSFMGKSWDYDVPRIETWRECLRVLKPGAPLVAFGGSRTYHRLACGIEDAGFELRDKLSWFYGKGFPKSQNISLALEKAGLVQFIKVWEGYGTNLKPAYEDAVLARKPLDGTMAQNVARWGVGGLAIDACRIGTESMPRSSSRGMPKLSENVSMASANYERQIVGEAEGRWPANLVLSHTEHCRVVGEAPAPGFARNRFTDGAKPFVGGAGHEYTSEKIPGGMAEVWECADECPIRLLDAEAGPRPSQPYRANEATGAVLPLKKRTAGGYTDSGGPSRFFYCSKVATKEREAGCEGLALRSAGEVTGGREEESAGLDNPRAGAGRTGGARNHHPTLKPIALTTWLTRLILPPTPGAVLLVPFAGAGSEMIGALKAGWGAVFGVEREAEYIEIARARLAHWCKESEAA